MTGLGNKQTAARLRWLLRACFEIRFARRSRPRPRPSSSIFWPVFEDEDEGRGRGRKGRPTSISKQALSLSLCVLFASGCSIRRIAINQLSDALAGSASTTFSSDNDPELVRAAVPFSLKLIEALLEESPNHRGLLLAASSGFTQFSYAFVQEDADELEAKDLSAAQSMHVRARRLYLRARNYGLHGLEVSHHDFPNRLRQDAKATLRAARKSDVPLLYWTAASWGAAISLSKDNPDLVDDLSLVEALIDRAVELDEKFDRGALHTFLITFEMVRPGGSGDRAARAKFHFERALALGGQNQAGPFVAYAEAVSVGKQDKAEFVAMLNRALAINLEVAPQTELVNLVMQRRARWLLSQTDEHFVEAEKPGEAKRNYDWERKK